MEQRREFTEKGSQIQYNLAGKEEEGLNNKTGRERDKIEEIKRG